jgi:uncharacterized protein (TIGR03084 family)
MDAILAALAEQHAELDGILRGLDDDGWAAPAPSCPGWTVADVVLHMAQTDELANASAQGEFTRFVQGTVRDGASTVDDAAAVMVEHERGDTNAAVHERWLEAATSARRALADCDPSDRVQWVAGDMAARTLATTRLSECWIHTGDVAEALGIEREPAARIWHIARLAWRTLPYAFERAGRTLHGPVAVSLKGTDGTSWDFVPDGDALTHVEGPALDFCLVAGRRREPAASALVATGTDAEAVLELVRTYA